MARPRSRLRIKTDDVLEIAGAAMGTTAVYLYFGLRGALICGAVALIVAAELIYDSRILRVPLPHRPRPVARAKDRLAKHRR